MSIRIGATSSPEIIEVAGRGELQLAVLIESMRREGFELQVSRPEVIIREIDGKPNEPVERAVVDVPDEHVGTVTQAVAPRKGKVTDLRPGDTGPHHRHPRGAGPRAARVPLAADDGDPRHRPGPSAPRRLDAVGGRTAASHRGRHRCSDRKGVTTGFALDNLQKRGELFIGPGIDVYEGMIIGEASRREEMAVNATKGKQLTNIRTHSTDEAIKLKPPEDPHSGDGDRVDRRRRAGRGDP